MKRQLAIVLPFAILTTFAAPAAQRGADRYALILSDPPLVNQIRSRAELHSRAAVAAARKIEAAQQTLRQELAARGIHVTGSVKTLLNAVFVEASRRDLGALRALPGVRRLSHMPPIKLHLNKAIDLINAPEAWTVVGGVQNAGAGVKIGIIDTGIDQTHPAFQDLSLTTPPNFPICAPQDCAYTNNKVIVARSYVLDVAKGVPPNPAEDSRPDDLSPRDRVGHGTALAMIAAGVQNTGSGATITGVAPKAFLGNYKIFGSPGVNDSTFSDVMTEALDQAFADGMDIVTLSLGSPALYGPQDLNVNQMCDLQGPANEACDARATAVENAVKGGMAVVVSAGNDGDVGLDVNGNTVTPTLNTVNTPGTAPSAITVGATTNAHIWFAGVHVTGANTPANLQNIPALFGDGPKPGGLYGPYPLRDVSKLQNDGFACAALPGGSLTNAIALIQRNDPSDSNGCLFSTKVSNAQTAGARGVIIYRESGASPDAPFPPAGLTGSGIPAVMISNADGEDLKNFLASNPDRPVTLDPALQAINASFNTVAEFSSHGPSIGNSAIKPDLVAVGTDLYTATQNYDPNSDLYDASRYTAVSGTSFPVPMVAGTLAMVKQHNPGLTTPAQLKSAVVNTASAGLIQENNAPAPMTAVGAGMLNAQAAVQTTVTLDPATLSFGVIPPGSMGMSATLQVSGPATSAEVAPANPQVTVQLAGPALTVTLQGSQPSPGRYEGYIVIHGGAVDVRVPYMYLVGDGVPFAIFPIVGDGFVGVAGQPIPSDFIAFKLVDRYGVPVLNAPVQFDGTIGGGGVCAGCFKDSQTDVYGIAAAQVDLGPQLGEQQFTATLLPPAPQLTAYFQGQARPPMAILTNGVVNGASFLSGQAVAPGSYISIFGSALSDANTDFFTPYLPLSLAGVSVSFDAPSQGISLPGRLHHVEPGQVNVQVPWELQGLSQVFLKVSLGNLSTSVYLLSLNNYGPGIFEQPSGSGWAAAQDGPTYAPITTSSPAHRGQLITIYCNGLGPVDQTPADGEPTPRQPLVHTLVTPVVSIGGRPARVDFAGLSPDSVALYQINVFVPDDAPSGTQPVTVTMNGVVSKAANLPIQQ